MKKSIFPVIFCLTLPFWTASGARAQVVVDNFASSNGFSSGFLTTNSGNYLAQSFLNGPTAYTSLNVTVEVNAKTTDPLKLGVFRDFTGFPDLASSNFVTAAPSGTGQQFLQFTNILTGLDPNAKYWVVLGSTNPTGDGSDFFWFHSLNDTNAGEGSILTGDGAMLKSSNSGLIWQTEWEPVFSGTTTFNLRIAGSSAVSAPEPGALLLALSGGLGMIALRRKRRG